jgi:excisionase family DNA binding protein
VQFLTVEQAAGLADVRPSVVYERVRSRELRALHVGRYVRFRREDIEAWAARDALTGYAAVLKAGKRCADCGAADDLQFHHLDPATKLFNVADAPTVAGAQSEAAKCVVLCRRCHRTRHPVSRVVSPNGDTEANSEQQRDTKSP